MTLPLSSNSFRHGQMGLTMLELMISLSLGLLLLVGIGTIYVGSSQSNRVQEDNARIQETGRFALEIMGRSIRQAGYAAITVQLKNSHTNCNCTPIEGLNNARPTASPSTDVITVQYDGTAGEQDCQAGNVNAGEIVQEAYFIADDSLRCDATRPAPAAPVAHPDDDDGVQLLRGIEDMQVVYGIDTNGDQATDQYTATPASWTQVVSARVCVLVRSDNQAIAAGRQSYLNCAGALGTATGAAATTTAPNGDTRLRRAFVATFNLRNRVTLPP